MKQVSNLSIHPIMKVYDDELESLRSVEPAAIQGNQTGNFISYFYGRMSFECIRKKT
ncbi:hypothetical protein GYMC10_3497 [Paenibacillus sp. Y412MC10]|nr:hypothetical protein GYMC10_3497 [Paenibacillus sp. Y412MC10]